MNFEQKIASAANEMVRELKNISTAATSIAESFKKFVDQQDDDMDLDDMQEALDILRQKRDVLEEIAELEPSHASATRKAYAEKDALLTATSFGSWGNDGAANYIKQRQRLGDKKYDNAPDSTDPAVLDAFVQQVWKEAADAGIPPHEITFVTSDPLPNLGIGRSHKPGTPDQFFAGPDKFIGKASKPDQFFATTPDEPDYSWMIGLQVRICDRDVPTMFGRLGGVKSTAGNRITVAINPHVDRIFVVSRLLIVETFDNFDSEIDPLLGKETVLRLIEEFRTTGQMTAKSFGACRHETHDECVAAGCHAPAPRIAGFDDRVMLGEDPAESDAIQTSAVPPVRYAETNDRVRVTQEGPHKDKYGTVISTCADMVEIKLRGEEDLVISKYDVVVVPPLSDFLRIGVDSGSITEEYARQHMGTSGELEKRHGIAYMEADRVTPVASIDPTKKVFYEVGETVEIVDSSISEFGYKGVITGFGSGNIAVKFPSYERDLYFADHQIKFVASAEPHDDSRE